MRIKWLEWAQQLQAIAQAGLTYSKDVYDLERFEMIRDLSVEIMEEYTQVDPTVIRELFASDTGYATPKVDVRGVVFQDRRILLVKETADGKWSVPGGWADVGYSASEVVVKEVQEESGFVVVPRRVIAVMDRARHPHPPHANYIYRIFFLCELVGGQASESIETSDVGFFERHSLPELSIGRITESQIDILYRYLDDPDALAYFD
ncbi:NUDIX hydrolase [Fundicoccus culcitae]|uniref:NUDIX hydrolase n=1 Tax=Fundicoccus culcitae TaxID=2969821 RepID=A0ABY5P2H2_9LACT|nr:NUDIX hydrolase [Fundicoccus culcitae]UUX32759.1 NUDIX hydrolase [Fundicoccus culcitae]